MFQHYKGKKIIITGASAGMGKDLALYLSTFDVHLVLLARREDLLIELKERCEKNGSKVEIYKADVANSLRMQEIADIILSKWDSVDIVIANAGIGGLNPADQFSLEINKKFIDVNLEGLANTLVPYIQSMIKNKAGQLVGISSLAAFRGLPGGASYSSTKAAQGVFLESLRVDLKKYGIAVSSIHPGFIETHMTNHEEFNMPFKIHVRESSILIAKALMKKKAVYMYPWQMRWVTYINKRLPIWLYDFLVPKISGQKDDIKAKVF